MPHCPTAAAALLLLLAIASHHLFLSPLPPTPHIKCSAPLPLRFRPDDGAFKILHFADMHFGNGAATRCRDIPLISSPCSDLNTTLFLRRLILREQPDLIAFTGDNIFGPSATDAAESFLRAVRPAVESATPWAAVLGNHDQESTMTRAELMSLASLVDYSVSKVNPEEAPGIDGFGNYDVRVNGAVGSELANTSVFNLYFLDSGDREVVNGVRTYGWIRESQQAWLRAASRRFQADFQAPALAFFHIPIPEVRELWYKEFRGQFQEGVACSTVNSGVLKTLVSMGDVKGVFLGHDHLNDFCGELDGIWFCYGGGSGYHGYGRAGWPRRARIISAELKRGKNSWMGVERIRTWKRLDDEDLTMLDEQVLWSYGEDSDASHVYL